MIVFVPKQNPPWLRVGASRSPRATPCRRGYRPKSDEAGRAERIECVVIKIVIKLGGRCSIGCAVLEVERGGEDNRRHRERTVDVFHRQLLRVPENNRV